MKLPPYPKYKPSGADWLGEIPEHWQSGPMKFLVSTPVTDGPHETPEMLEVGIPFVSAEAISDGRINFNAIWGYISYEDHHRYSRKYKPKRGDIYMVKSGATTGRIAVVDTDREFNIWSPLAAIRCNPRRVNSNFVYFYLQSREFQTAVELHWSFGTQQNIGMGVIQNLRVPVPSLQEQHAIARFLDRQIAKIDTLLAKKRTLIERLKEKRNALISRTVTRGLRPDAARAAGINPNPKLKPSGIDWLGMVPEHWRTLRLRRAVVVLDCKHKTVSFVDDGIPLASIGEVHGDVVDLSKAKQTTEEEYIEMIEGGRRPQLGDIIYSRNATVGDAALVTTSTRFCMGQDVCLIRASKENPRYLLYLLKSRPLLEQVESLMIGSTFRRINVGQIKAFWTCLPSPTEQQLIANFLDREVTESYAMITKVQTAIERLQEYRTALITAAVTGKIDVRGAVA